MGRPWRANAKHTLILHRRAMPPYSRVQAMLPKALTSGGCQQGDQGWKLFLQKLKRKGKHWEKTRVKVTTTS